MLQEKPATYSGEKSLIPTQKSKETGREESLGGVEKMPLLLDAHGNRLMRTWCTSEAQNKVIIKVW